MAQQGPAGYYYGPPKNHDGKNARQAPPQSQAGDEQVNAHVPGYYGGKVRGKKTAAGDQSSAAAAQPHKESGFLANCCPCFSGGQTK